MIDPLAHKVRALKRRKKKAPLSEEIRSMVRSLTLTLALLILGSTGLYLALNSQGAAKGYQLEQLRQSVEDLASESRALDHQMIEAQSFVELQAEEDSGSMKTYEEVDYTYINPETDVASTRP